LTSSLDFLPIAIKAIDEGTTAPIKVSMFEITNTHSGIPWISMQCLEQDGMLLPYTRDTFGIAIKATYCEVDGKPVPVYKDSKTDAGSFKKSQRGMRRLP